jgi:hypothetical protein
MTPHGFTVARPPQGVARMRATSVKPAEVSLLSLLHQKPPVTPSVPLPSPRAYWLFVASLALPPARRRRSVARLPEHETLAALSSGSTTFLLSSCLITRRRFPVPVGVRIDLPGATLEWYDELIATTGFLPDGPLVAHALCHWVAATEDGICMVQIWESQEAFKIDAKKRTGQVLEEVGVPGTPVITYFDVHNFLPGRRTRA